VPHTGDRKPFPGVQSLSLVDEPQVSRDGRWLAYSANDTGQWEVYVQPFMPPVGVAGTSYFLRPAFRPARLREPAWFSARLAAQYARIFAA